MVIRVIRVLRVIRVIRVRSEKPAPTLINNDSKVTNANDARGE